MGDVGMVLTWHDGRPQWRIAGTWGAIPWDASLPGVVLGSKAFVLRLVNSNSYPSLSGSKAEIQMRDLSDRVNHTFTTYAKLDQIWAAEHPQCSHMWLQVRDGALHVVGITGWRWSAGFYGDDFNPIRLVDYHLDSIGSGQVGVFTLVNEITCPSTSTAVPWIDGPSSTGSVGVSAGADPQLHWDVVEYTSGITHTYTGWGSSVITWYSPQTAESTGAWFPWGWDGEQWNLTETQKYTPRAVALVSGPVYEYEIREDYSGLLTNNVANSPELHVALQNAVIGTTAMYANGVNIRFLHPGSDWSLGGRFFYAHPATFLPWGNHADAFGGAGKFHNSGSKASPNDGWEYFYVTRGRAYGVMTVPYTPPVNHYLAGVWGAGEAFVYQRNNDNSWLTNDDLAYSDFYVVKAGDAMASNKYSIFADLQDDGSVIHIEGLEDPTPTLWVDDLQIAELN